MKQLEKNRAGDVIFVIVTVILILIASLCIKKTVFGVDHMPNEEREQYLAALEKEMLMETRQVLQINGFKNSGVMVNRVVDRGIYRYTIFIHHQDIQLLDADAIDALSERIESVYFTEAGCEITHIYF